MSTVPNSPATHSPPCAASARSDEKRLYKLATRLLMIAGLVIVVLVAAGLWTRASAERRLQQAALSNSASRVAVVKPVVSQSVEELTLPASVQAFTEAPIYARTQGYLKKWYFDIGAHVKRGELLAEIETPEGDQQLAQARADLKVAQANAALAQTTADRWQILLKKNAVSQQETDKNVDQAAAKQAAVDAAQANVHRLEQLQSFEKVYAPFDGVITARSTDVGALIDGGSSPKELFHLAALDRLRIYSAVPETSAAAIKAGGEASLTLDQFPNRVFRGTITRDAGAIDPGSRTLNVEVDIPNPSGELLPGSYGFLHLKLPGRAAPMTIPANALIFRAQGLQVAVARQGRASIVPITIGRDFGDTVEISSGLARDDTVILDPSDALVDGAPVEVETAH